MKISELRNKLKYLPDDYEILIKNPDKPGHFFTLTNEVICSNFDKTYYRKCMTHGLFKNICDSSNVIDSIVMIPSCNSFLPAEREIIVDQRCLSYCADSSSLVESVVQDFEQMYSYWTNYTISPDTSSYVKTHTVDYLYDTSTFIGEGIAISIYCDTTTLTTNINNYDSTSYTWINQQIIDTTSNCTQDRFIVADYGIREWIDSTSFSIRDTTTIDNSYTFNIENYNTLIKEIVYFLPLSDKMYLNRLINNNMVFLTKDCQNNLIIRSKIGITHPIFGKVTYQFIVDILRDNLDILEQFSQIITKYDNDTFYLTELNDVTLEILEKVADIIYTNNGLLKVEFTEEIINSLQLI